MPVETSVSDSFRQDLVDSGIVIRTEELTKVYEMGAEQVHALSGVDVDIRKGDYVAIMRAVRVGKIHADELDRLPGSAECRALLAGGTPRQRS